jgi:catechol 2,3-dioxygenase-like lactoylglutathione lyase family enzyme
MKLVELAFFTHDVAEMAAFYRQLLQAEPTYANEGMAIFMTGETKIFIHQLYVPSEGELPPTNHMAFSVPDLDAACHNLQHAGLQLEHAPREYYWGRSAYLRDPNGQQIELIQDTD